MRAREPHPDERQHVRNKPLVQMIALGLVGCAILIPIGLSIHWFPILASSQAHKIHTLYDVLIIVSVPVFAIVETVVLYSVWKFRMKPGQELEDGPPTHGNTRLEIVWTAAPALLILALCIYSYVLLVQIEKKPAHELVVDVTGQQFAWSYSYPVQQGIAKPIASDTLYLPKNESVKFRLHAKDVIHDFWVPSFGMKLDAVPGQDASYRVTPDRLGTYPAACLELCGLGHSTMRSTVKVITPVQFTAWVKGRGGGGAAAAAAPASPAKTDPVALGKQVFVGEGGCGSCHQLADAGTSGTAGPDLDRFLKGKTPAFIKASILTPNAVVEKGYAPGVMPQTFGQQLSGAQIDGLVAYLAKVTG